MPRMGFKYIAFKNNMNLEKIVLFNHCTHEEMWHGMILFGIPEPVGAGFVDMKSMTCYGRSETLNLNSRPELDTKLLRFQSSYNPEED